MSLFTQDPAENDTWQRVLAGDMLAYQTIVETNQSAVSAVAYSIIGDFPISQDIAQETFWVAWKKRDKLRDTSRLKSWLCGIARNLAKNWRKQNKGNARPIASDSMVDPVSPEEDPLVQSIADEERAVVWSALEDIPENYREVLTLYYREEQSVAEVSKALDISVDTARQRLSRGRTMLRGRVAQLIEGVLVRSKPDRSFPAKVIAGLTAVGISAKSGTATASTLTTVKASGVAGGTTVAVNGLATGAAMGGLGGLLGTIGGLGGAFIGIWLPAQLAPTETERQLLLQRGKVVFGLCIVQVLAVLALTLSFIYWQFSPLLFLAVLLSITIPFIIAVIIQALQLAKQSNELRKHITPGDDPNQSRLANRMPHTVRRGKKWTSRHRLLGLPLIDIQIGDIEIGSQSSGKVMRSRAKGWIAIGDIATGLIAIGGIARGAIALGGLAIGLFAMGGGAIGMLAFGGGAAGLYAIGGGAIGRNAAGGGAVGMHAAAGGVAVAWHAAAGGGALAHDYAVGGAALANEVNTLRAEEVIHQATMIDGLDWFIENQILATFLIVVICTAPVIFLRFLFHKGSPPEAIR